MAENIPAWIAELADSGRIDTPPAAESALATKLERLSQAFEQASHRSRAEPSAAAFRWGHLQAMQQLGHGSYGDVYRAFDTVLEREVALKLRHGDEAHSRAFIAEARRLAQVRHPNVVAVHGAAVHEGRPGLWADLLEGRTIAAAVAEDGPLDWPRLLAISRDLLSALAAVHAAGLVHADVKPANVMLDPAGSAILMDFGAAAELDAAARFGVLGTPLSMAPEQLRGESVDASADLYALGVVLFFAAFGRYPVHGATLAGLQAAQREFDPAGELAARKDLPRGYRELLARWLDRDPGARPAAAESLHRLEQIAAAPARRKRRLAVSAIMASLALALLVSLFALYRIDAERAAAETARKQQQAVSSFLQDTLAAPDPGEAGADVTVASVLDRALIKARDQFHDEPAILLPLLRTIGNSYEGMGLNRKAEPILVEALELSRRLGGPDSATSLELQLLLLDVRWRLQPQNVEYLASAKAILSRARRLLGDGHRVTVYAALHLADMLASANDADAARPHLDFVLTQRPAGTPRQAQRAAALLALANIENHAGQHELAVRHFEQVLAIADTHGGAINRYAARNGLAVVHIQRGEPALAETQFRAMLAGAERFGESHRNLRIVLLNLGGVLNVQHKYAEAEAVLRRAIELSERYAGENHTVLYQARNNLTTNLAASGRLEEAGRIRRQLLADATVEFGADHPFTLMMICNLAEQRLLEGNAAAAMELAHDGAARAERVLGAEHVITLEDHELAARAHFAAGERTAAITDMAGICARKREVLGPDHQYSLSCISHRADMLAAVGRDAEAITLLEGVLEATTRTLGPDNPGTIDARAHLQQVARATTQ